MVWVERAWMVLMVVVLMLEEVVVEEEDGDADTVSAGLVVDSDVVDTGVWGGDVGVAGSCVAVAAAPVVGVDKGEVGCG